MSSRRQRVLRAVRLLPQAVKIGIAEEPDPPEEPKPEPKPERERPAPRPKAAPRPAPAQKPAPPSPDRALLKKIDALQESLTEAELRYSQLNEAKERLEAEIDGVKADYEGRKRTLEAESAAAAAKAAEEARTQGHKQGWEAGHSEGLSAAQAEVKKEYLDKFSTLVSGLEGVQKRLEEDFSGLVALNQPRMIRLWTEMLRRMLRRQVELHPDTVDTVLSELLSQLSDKNQVLIYVSPEDAGHLEADMETEFQEVLRGIRHLELKADPNVDPGSCIVETGMGVYDARWRTQMGQVESVVDDIFQQITKDEGKGTEEAKAND